MMIYKFIKSPHILAETLNFSTCCISHHMWRYKNKKIQYFIFINLS